MIDATVSWVEENQRALVESLATIRFALELHAEPKVCDAVPTGNARPGLPAQLPVTLANLVGTFGLSPFERDVVLLCAGMELDARFAGACARAHGDAAMPYPTFGLALAVLDAAHWSALSPTAPLRRWRLLTLCGDSISTSPLRIDERILHELTGVRTIDERVLPYVDERQSPALRDPSYDEIASAVVQKLSVTNGFGGLKIVLCGADADVARGAAAAACRGSGLGMMTISAARLPAAASELHALATLFEREALLMGLALFVEDDRALERGARERILSQLAALAAPVVVSTSERAFAVDGFSTIDIPKGAIAENAASRPSIRDRSRSRLGGLAQRIEASVGWNDLVLPERQLAMLRRFCDQMRYRDRVYEQWGFARRGSRGLGIAALFAGAAGNR